MFLSTDCTFSSSCSVLFSEIFALLLLCFLLELFIGVKRLSCLKLFAYNKNISSVSFILGRETKSSFSLLLSDSKLLVFLLTLKPLHGSMIFYVFHLNFTLHDSLENVVSEHTEWMKSQNLSGGSAPNPSKGT